MFQRGSLALKIPIQACGKERLRGFASSARNAARTKGSHYDALMLPKNATKQQVKAKFYELSKKYHPDKTGGDISKFHEINDAYATLGDESKRRQYDLSITPASQSPRRPHASNPAHHSSFRANDPYLHRAAQGPHRAWHGQHASSHPPPGWRPKTETYNPFGHRTPPHWQYSPEYNYSHAPNARTTDRAGWGKRRSSQGDKEEKHGGGGGVWRFVITVGLIFTVISLGGSLTANTESEEDWAFDSQGEDDKEINSSRPSCRRAI
ncbi:hypothetical protein AYX14_02272 [Cryptococcus neoformans]|nr:hypothetical protein AYX15_00462 [Cryptococcus neoformans var. grubii]OWZ72303.1 hypothetical protein AYX14_02272 [Cryptococcus neoformans var. grubii]OWZ79188.1 hypothetical protein C365_02116 [Cryptococcus neoformans var. grubii Bt85]OXG20377.1 hypothetical protein C366_01910 [Cryptococcus neoformans var. grubii Tu401-1]OXM80244.1 hypothetical protein C364_01868 [Cryptococcus neoformans var. grubii Bt63]